MGKKGSKRAVLPLLLIALSFCLVSCSYLQDPASDELLLAAVEAVGASDEETFVSLFHPETRGESEAAIRENFREILGTFRGELLVWKKTKQSSNAYRREDGEPQYIVSCVYRVETDTEVYLVSTVRKEYANGENGFTEFHIVRDE